MTETQVTELLERATADLHVDERLVAAGIAAGRRRRRRHLVGTAAATVAVLGLTGVGLTVAMSGGGGGSHAVDPAAPSSPRRAAAPGPASVQPWSLGVTAAQVPATFGALVPGTIATVPNKEPDDANPIIDFRWNGSAIRVGLTSDSYITGTRVPDPRVRCQEFGSDTPCAPGGVPGSYEQSSTWTGPAADGGVTVRVVTVYFAEGWDVTVMEANAADFKDSPVLAPDVPLTLGQLREVAYSDVWFR